MPEDAQTVIRFFWFFAFLFFSTAVIGAVQNHTTVPWWDMWDGYLNFYHEIRTGNWGAWWAQHNEHRIFISKIFFWMDLEWFLGTGWFLIAINYLLVLSACVTFFVIWKERSNGSTRYVPIFLIAWLFSWPQRDNLTIGFQSPFFLAQLLPLLALFFLYRSTKTNHQSSFIAASLLGVFSIGTMANGILALPIMTLYGLIVRQSWKRTLVLLVLTVLCFLGYFHGFNFGGGKETFFAPIKHNPLGALYNIILYVGGPYYYLIGNGTVRETVSAVAGGSLILLSILFSAQALRSPRQNTYPLALLAFIFYIGGTAAGTGMIRVSPESYGGPIGRYLTPALMAWGVLFVLISNWIEANSKKIQRWAWVPFAALILLMLPEQRLALRSRDGTLFEHQVGALSLALQIKDEPQISLLYPFADRALMITKNAVLSGDSVFGFGRIPQLQRKMGASLKANFRLCTGQITKIEAPLGQDQYLKIEGWIQPDSSDIRPRTAYLLDANSQVQGVAMSGLNRPEGGYVWKGYLRSDTRGQSMRIFVPDSSSNEPESGCYFDAHIDIPTA